MSSTAEHRAPSASNARLYGTGLASMLLPNMSPHALVQQALRNPDGAGLGSRKGSAREGYGQHVDLISEHQLTAELQALGYYFPHVKREALLWAWETEGNPLNYSA